MNVKYEALKTLGFNYVARNMDNGLAAFMYEPIRSMTVLAGYEEAVRDKFNKVSISNIDIEKDEYCSYKDGCNIDFCWFIRSEEDTKNYTIMHLDKDDKDFVNVTWENSPVKLQ